MKLKHLTLMLLALPAFAFAATPVAANCDNYGNQVSIGSSDSCTVNSQYCDQRSGAGGGAGAGGPGENGASAQAGASTSCTQQNPGHGPGMCSVLSGFSLTVDPSSAGQSSLFIATC